jgi:hypothetical protein
VAQLQQQQQQQSCDTFQDTINILQHSHVDGVAALLLVFSGMQGRICECHSMDCSCCLRAYAVAQPSVLPDMLPQQYSSHVAE